MQPTQQQPEQWQQPTATQGAAPYQAPEAPTEAPVETEAKQPVQEELATEETEQAPIEGTDASLLEEDAVLLRWEGTEYVHLARGALWYVIFAIVAIVAIILAIIVLKSITFAILVPVMALALLVYVRRAPEVLQYTLSRKGLYVNDKLYTYDTFRAFGVVSHNENHSAVLIPRKRFQIGQTIYFPEELGEQLVDMLAARLPMTEIKPDAVDQLLAKLHL